MEWGGEGRGPAAPRRHTHAGHLYALLYYSYAPVYITRTIVTRVYPLTYTQTMFVYGIGARRIASDDGVDSGGGEGCTIIIIIIIIVRRSGRV